MNSFKPFVCSRCDRGFSRKYDLERHERHVHRESEEDASSDGSAGSEISENEESDEMEDNEAYQEWYDEALDATEEMRRDKYQKYINEGMDPRMAKEKAHLKTLWAIKREFFNQYKAFLRDYARLKNNEVHTEVTDELDDKVDIKGGDPDKAVKRILAKNESKFDALFQFDDDEEDSGEEEENEMESGE